MYEIGIIISPEAAKMAAGSRHRWKTVQLPEELLQRADKIIEHPEFGYTSRAEFIKEAVRLRVEALESNLRERAGRR